MSSKAQQAPAYALLAAILRDGPAVPDAACRRYPQMFSAPDDPLTVELCVSICRHCKAFEECRSWAQSRSTTEREAQRGQVVAGELVK